MEGVANSFQNGNSWTFVKIFRQTVDNVRIAP